MTAVAFDTLKFARTLRETAQMTTEEAEGLAVAIAEAVQGDMATKGDVIAAGADIREAELRLLAKIEAAKTETIKGMIEAIGFQTLIIVGAIVALSKGIH